MSLVLDEHREYLSDHHRIRAYRRAIDELVRPGYVVVDLGSGSGLLGLFACRAGAARVYCIEASELIELTREVFRRNGFADRVTFLKDMSTSAVLPEPADLIVADQAGRFGFEAGIFEYFADARARFLKPAGKLLPSRVDFHIAPVEHEEMWSRVEFWNSSPAGFDFSSARRIAVNTGYPVKFEARHLLGAPATIASQPTGECPASIVGIPSVVEVTRSGTVHGIGAWFSAQLSPRGRMSNGPLDADSIGRRNVFLPIDRPVAVRAGDAVSAQISIRPRDQMLSWQVAVRRAGDHCGDSKALPFVHVPCVHSTFQGMLLCREDLDRSRPGFVPKLTPRGEARRTVLELCDGKRPLEQIEGEVYRRHQGLFAAPDEAAAFVSEVISVYAR